MSALRQCKCKKKQLATGVGAHFNKHRVKPRAQEGKKQTYDATFSMELVKMFKIEGVENLSISIALP